MNVNRVGDYTLCERLDAGGRIERYRAIDARSGEQVVVTRLPGRVEGHWPPWADPRIAALLDHPTIVRLLDVVEAPDHVAFVTELVDGVDLRRLLSRGPVPIPSALTIAAEVCRALHVAHNATGLDGSHFPFIHGWLCPRCIFLSWEGAAKLGRFAVGRTLQDGDDRLPVDPSDERLNYLSPEQVRGEEAEVSSDLFLLGIVLHEMIAGERPFVGETPLALLNAIKNGQRRSLPTRLSVSLGRAASPPRPVLQALDDLLGWTLALRPEERPKSAAELLLAIETLARRFDIAIGPGALSAHINALTA